MSDPTPPPRPFDQHGMFADRYQLERKLGDGGMAETFLCRERGNPLPLVVKIYREIGLSACSIDIKRLVDREALCLSTLHHTNIVEYRTHGVSEGRAFLVLEYLRGELLVDRVQTSVQSPAEVLDWLCGVAEALDWAHGRDVIHRDIKPANLMFDDAGRLRILDFGIAHVGQKLTDMFGTGHTDLTDRFRTRWYAAPEDRRDTREADLYSLAMTVYFALTRCLPWNAPRGLDERELRRLVAPLPITKFRPDLPPGLDAVFASAFDPDPKARHREFPNCRFFAGRFRQIVETPPAERSAAPAIDVVPRVGHKSVEAPRRIPFVPAASPDLPGGIPGFTRHQPRRDGECHCFVHDGTGIEFLLVPSAGSREQVDGKGRADMPIEVASYLLARSPCTWAQFRANRRVAERIRNQQPDEPAELVSWSLADEFCKSFGWCLPSEAEWEFACRSGGRSDGLPRLLPEHRGGVDRLPRVGETPRNRFGFEAMFGGVFEWCEDAQPSPFGTSRSATAGRFRALRGGAANELASSWHPSRRQVATEGTEIEFVGFRPAVRLRPTH